MPDSDEVPDSTEQVPDSTDEAPPRRSAVPPVQIAGPGVSRWAAPAALLISVVAIAVAIWALVNESSRASAGTRLPGDPKTRVCAAFDTVSKAVPLQTNTEMGPDPVARSSVSANARLALFGGGQYLLNQLDAATPKELADPIRSFANNLRDIGMNALADAQSSDPDQVFRMAKGDTTRLQIADLCK
jgi:hypothetical protein